MADQMSTKNILVNSIKKARISKRKELKICFKPVWSNDTGNTQNKHAEKDKGKPGKKKPRREGFYFLKKVTSE